MPITFGGPDHVSDPGIFFFYGILRVDNFIASVTVFEVSTHCVSSLNSKTKIADLSIGEKPCSFLDEKDCRFDFAYEIDRDTGNVLLWAKQDLDCPEPVNTTGEF